MAIEYLLPPAVFISLGALLPPILAMARVTKNNLVTQRLTPDSVAVDQTTGQVFLPNGKIMTIAQVKNKLWFIKLEKIIFPSTPNQN